VNSQLGLAFTKGSLRARMFDTSVHLVFESGVFLRTLLLNRVEVL
jgi:hypothetical protein